MLVGVAAGGVLACVHAVFSIAFRADQVVSGVAVNLLALGITGYVFIAHYGDQGTPGDVARVPEIELPGVKEIPFIGDVIGEMSVLTWVALLLVPVVALYLFRTPGGLRLRSVGEKPRAADSVGIPVLRTRYLAVIASGCLAGMGGVFLSVALVGSFNEGMTAGRGFIALAVVIFGAWRPVRRARRRLSVRLLERCRAAAAGVLGVARRAVPGAALRPGARRRRRADRPLPAAGRDRRALR